MIGHQEGGFTLLEMLVALTVLGFLMVGLNQGVRAGIDLWNAQSRRIDETSDLSTSARLLRDLLTRIPIKSLAGANVGGGTSVISFAGNPDQLAFVADLPTGLGGTDRSDIGLVVSNHSLVLLWRPRRQNVAVAKPAFNKVELMRGVSMLQFAYWGRASAGGPAGWSGKWTSSGPPLLIRVRLTFMKGDSRHWPDLIVAPQLASAYL